MFTYGSLFAGIGGFDLGFDRAGMTCLWQVEIDDFCTRVLEKHWPKVERFRDVRECGKHNLKPVDVICGGFPCQPHSLAGERRGAEDDRDLWPEFKRIINELRPRWVVAENVPGIRTTILDQVLSDLEGMGYAWEAAIIPACAVDAPHRRDRVWIVAHTKSKGTRHERQNRGSRSREINTSNNTSSTSGRNDRFKDRAITMHGPKQWLPEPGLGRVADGVPNRVDRLRALGNACVPQLTEFIGRLILAVEKEQATHGT